MRHYSIFLIVLFLCFVVVSNNCLAQSNLLIGVWDKVSGPGDPIRLTFQPDSKVLIHFQTSIDTARYLTFPIYSSSLKDMGYGQDGIGSWRGIYDVSSDTLKIEGFWYTGVPPTPTPTFFNTPTTYERVTTGIINNNEDEIPESFVLHQNYPNPFNPSTKIEYSVQNTGIAIIKIYNNLGQLVRTLVDEEKSAGKYTEIWDSKDNNSKQVASGTYFYQLQVGEFTSTKKIIFLK